MYHSFDTDVAARVGVNAAVLYNHILFWVLKNKANDDNFKDGTWWTYCKMDAFVELFPYLTKKQVRTALDKLRDSGLVITGNYNTDKRDRTIWYTIPADEIAQKGTAEKSIRADTIAKKGESTIYNIISNTDISNTDICAKAQKRQMDTPPGRAEQEQIKVVRHCYGEYNNVRLSDPELEKLQNEFPDDWQERIERLSCYMESHGKTYKSHLATIRNWAKKDQQAKTATTAQNPDDGWAYLEEQYQKGEL